MNPTLHVYPRAPSTHIHTHTLSILPHAGSPADLVHLQRGDTLISVNGGLIRSFTHGELVGMIKEAGQKGSMVLGVQRRG